jgi:hypothetical protein
MTIFRDLSEINSQENKSSAACTVPFAFYKVLCGFMLDLSGNEVTSFYLNVAYYIRATFQHLPTNGVYIAQHTGS